MERHLLEVDDLFDRLEAAGMELDNDTKVCMLLRSLPPSFDSLVSALDGRPDDDVTLEVVKAKLTDEYDRRLERDASASDANTERAMRSEVRQETRTCYFYKMPGHIRRDCRKYMLFLRNEESELRDDNIGRGKAKVAQGDVKPVAFTAGIDSRSWLLDSGASAHMTGERAFFSELNEFEGGWITMANGQKTPIQGEGRGVLYGYDDCKNVVRIEMSGVMFVPGLATSLVSVAKLTQKDLSVHFGREDCKIIDSTGDTVVTGTRHGNLYHLRVAEVAPKTADTNNNSLLQWRGRFDDHNWAATERLSKERLINRIGFADLHLQQKQQGSGKLKATVMRYVPPQLRWTRDPRNDQQSVHGGNGCRDIVGDRFSGGTGGGERYQNDGSNRGGGHINRGPPSERLREQDLQNGRGGDFRDRSEDRRPPQNKSCQELPPDNRSSYGVGDFRSHDRDRCDRVFVSGL